MTNDCVFLKANIVAKLTHESHRAVHSLSAHPSATNLLTAAESKVYLWSNKVPENDE